MTEKKPCPICAAWITEIDYKNVELLKKHITKFNKIVPRYYSWTCLKHQKMLENAIKQARYVALLPYVLDLR